MISRQKDVVLLKERHTNVILVSSLLYSEDCIVFYEIKRVRQACIPIIYIHIPGGKKITYNFEFDQLFFL